jgi:hypothetical protein
MSVGEDPRPGRTSTSTNDDNVDRVRALFRGNRHLTVREVADEVGISILDLPIKVLLKSIICVASRQFKIRAAFLD